MAVVKGIKYGGFRVRVAAISGGNRASSSSEAGASSRKIRLEQNQWVRSRVRAIVGRAQSDGSAKLLKRLAFRARTLLIENQRRPAPGANFRQATRYPGFRVPATPRPHPAVLCL